MRELADSTRIERFMRELGKSTSEEGRVYLTGGATAVLEGWRDTTIDVDIKLIPDSDEILPLPTEWEERSPLIGREGKIFTTFAKWSREAW